MKHVLHFLSKTQSDAIKYAYGEETAEKLCVVV